MLQELIDYQYLTPEHLNGFDNYKYSARDTSPLSIYCMHPFWNWIVKFFPRWLAPNVMTFVGFLCTVLNFLLLSYYDWNFYASSSLSDTTPIPRWVWLCAAVNIFLAYTLDGIDGKQARRIGLSGPLGELFDHGLDSYTAVLIPTCLYSIFGRCPHYSVSPLRMYYVCWMVFFNFFVSHWEKYNTGVLYLPWGYDLSMWGSTIMYFLTWLYGFEFWKRDLTASITLGHVMEFVLHFSAMANIPMIIVNVYNSYVYRTGKMRSLGEAIRPVWPCLTFMILLLAWPMISPNNIMEKDPRALFMLSGTIFSNISGERNSADFKTLQNYVYMTENCLAECHQEYLMRFCNCSMDLLFPPGKYPPCKPKDFICLARNNEHFVQTHSPEEREFGRSDISGMICKCYRNCNSLNYVPNIRSNYLTPEFRKNLSFVDLDVHFRFDFLMVYRTDLVYDWIDLLVAFGGAAGLFLGCSLISAIETVFFICIEMPKFIAERIRSHSRRKFVRTHDEGHPRLVGFGQHNVAEAGINVERFVYLNNAINTKAKGTRRKDMPSEHSLAWQN